VNSKNVNSKLRCTYAAVVSAFNQSREAPIVPLNRCGIRALPRSCVGLLPPKCSAPSSTIESRRPLAAL